MNISIDIIQKWFQRATTNPVFTNKMKERTRYNKIYLLTIKENQNIYTEINIIKPCGVLDFMELLALYKDYIIALQDSKDPSLFRTNTCQYIKNNVVLSDGLTNRVLRDDLYPTLHLQGIPDTVLRHRDRMLSILPENTHLIIVNHINGNKTDYNWFNLEPSNHSRNILHSIYELGNDASCVAIRRTDNYGESIIITSIINASLDANVTYDTMLYYLATYGYFENNDFMYEYEDPNYFDRDRTIVYIKDIDLDLFKNIERIELKNRVSIFTKNRYKISHTDVKVLKIIDDNKYLEMTQALRKGYMSVNLTDDNGVTGFYLIHRLVNIIHNPIDKYFEFDTDHINKNQLDNNKSNLRWLTRKEHAKITKGFKPFVVSNEQNIVVGIFPDVDVLYKLLYTTKKIIQDACSRNIFLFGYKFSYCSDEYYKLNKNINNDLQFVKEKSFIPVKCSILGKDILFNHIAEAEDKLGMQTRELYGFIYKHPEVIIDTITHEDGTVEKKIELDYNIAENSIKYVLAPRANIVNYTIIKKSRSEYIIRHYCGKQDKICTTRGEVSDYLKITPSSINNFYKNFKHVINTFNDIIWFNCCVENKFLHPAIIDSVKMNLSLYIKTDIKISASICNKSKIDYELKYPYKYNI